MTEFISQANCGNSPKMQLIEAFHRAQAYADLQTLLAMVTDEFHWDLIGSQSISGKADFEDYLKTSAQNQQVKTYSLYTVLSHGRYGAADGELELAEGKHMAFSTIFEFANAKGTQIKSVKTYLISLP